MSAWRGTIWLLATAVLALAAGGCLKVCTRIQLNPDGSATITERLRFSQRLLDLDSKQKPAEQIARLLTREAALQRMQHMGKGIRLVRHEIRTAERAARESVAVFHIGDLSDLRYVSPFLAYADYPENCKVACRMVPLYKSRNYVGSAGQMAVSFRPVRRPRRHPRPDPDAPPPKGPTPLAQQKLRRLRAVFADLLEDFEIRLTFATYCPIRECGVGMRGRRAGVSQADLIHFSDATLDQFGGMLLDNEEIVLDLLGGNVGSKNVVEAVRQFANNTTVPVFVPAGSAYDYWRGGDEICFAPSRALFDRHFAGKKLDYSRWAPSPPEKLVPADFEKIGHKPRKAKESAAKE
jgi:hypothetical protein